LAHALIQARLSVSRVQLHGWSDRDILGRSWGRSSGRRCAACLELPQLLFEDLIAMLQFLVLSGQRPKPLFQLLDADFGIVGVGLRKDSLRQKVGRQNKRRGNDSYARKHRDSE